MCSEMTENSIRESSGMFSAECWVVLKSIRDTDNETSKVKGLCLSR